MKNAFINRHGELRSGWRIAVFVLAASALTFLSVFPLRLVIPLMRETGLDVIGQILAPVMALAGALAATYLVTRFLNRKPMAAIGLWFHPRTVSEFGWGVLLGFLGMALIFLTLSLIGDVDISLKEAAPLAVGLTVLGSLVHFSAAAMLEEVLFRGYPFQTLVQGVTVLPAVLIMAVLFALAHLSNPNASAFGMINIALAAVLLSFAYLKTRSLWLPFGLHLSWNFCQTTMFGFRTSGIEFDQFRIFVLSVNAPDWLSGGAFGPEGGALATVSLLICTVFILKSSRFEAPSGIITLDSVEDLPIPPGIQAEELS